MATKGGREGDWNCGICWNTNYAFRSFCNRCRQPRIFVDAKSSTDSKWVPRAGDWICMGCTNNNYASRELCKKCGCSREIAAMSAFAMPGASFPTYAHYFARAQGGIGQMNIRALGNDAAQQPLFPGSNWPLGVENFRAQALGGGLNSALTFGNNLDQSVPNGWRHGDWICNCGFHNYSSRAQCKKCNASVPSAPGTKRVASEELAEDLDNKRLNAGQPSVGAEHLRSPVVENRSGAVGPLQAAGIIGMPNFQANMLASLTAINSRSMGKGSRQWREGDWFCSNCSNHNFASRSLCNRCRHQKESDSRPEPPPT